jgi:hypothetical protein
LRDHPVHHQFLAHLTQDFQGSVQAGLPWVVKNSPLDLPSGKHTKAIENGHW